MTRKYIETDQDFRGRLSRKYGMVSLDSLAGVDLDEVGKGLGLTRIIVDLPITPNEGTENG